MGHVPADLARRVYETAHLTGEFLLRSGQTSTEYFDKFRLNADPKLLHQIAEAMAAVVPPGVDALAGMEMGGIPLVTALSQVTGLPARFVRKKAKEYGTRTIAEGGPVTGLRLLAVEDVVTTGGQVLLSTADLRAEGAIVEACVCIIDREAGGRAAFAEIGLDLRPLFTISELHAAANQTSD
jgi:orotate phosphoribosyltransferase